MPERIKERVKIRLLAKTPDVDVWLVRGKEVRKNLAVDFVEGAHEYVKYYSSLHDSKHPAHKRGRKIVPRGELWIDDALHPSEYNAVMIHELYERELMKKGMDYNTAHDRASLVELRSRREPQVAKKAFIRHGAKPFWCVKCKEWHNFRDKVYYRHLRYNHNA